MTLADQYSANSEVQFWDVESGERRLTIPLPNLQAAALSRDGTRLAATSSATPGAPVTLWDTANGQQLIALAGQGSARLAFSSDGKRLACGGGNRIVTLWEVETGRRLGQDVHLDAVWGVAFSPNDKMLASSTLGGAIKLWDTTQVEEATTIPSVANASLRFAMDGRTLLVGGSGPTKRIDVAAGKEMAVVAAGHVKAISADANVLAGPAGPDQSILRDVRDGREISTLPLPRRPNTSTGLTLSPDGKLLATFYRWGVGNKDNTVNLWNVATQQPRTLKVAPPESNRLSVLCAEFSPDGKLLAAGHQFQWVTVWDVATGKVKLQFSQQPAMMSVISLAFSPDNQALAVGTDVGAVTLWEVATGKRLASFKGHASRVHSLAFTSDGKTLATAGEDQTVRLWDVLTGQERSTLAGHKGPVHKVQFSPDGNILATASLDRTVKLWRASTDPEALARRTILASDDPNYQIASQANNTAWALATSFDLEERNPARAVELAKKAVELTPTQGSYWNTLGVAHYRAGDWKAALAALENSRRLLTGKLESFNTFFLAMAHWQLGEKVQAREWYDKAVAWMEKNAKDNPELQRFRFEAAEALGPSGAAFFPRALAGCC